MKYALLFFVSSLLVNCGSVVYDYEKNQDFSQYKTYNFYPELRSGLSQLDEKRWKAAVENTMQAKGFTLSNQPNVYINLKSQEFRDPSGNSVGVGVGSGGGGVNVNLGSIFTVGSPRINLRLTIDMVDVQKDDLVWQGSTEKRFYPNAKPEVREEYFSNISQRIFKKYPPKK